MTSVAERKAALEARLADLSEKLVETDAELDAHSSQDWEELAVEREDDEVLEDLGNSAQHEMRMIRAALKRIDEGEYGYCVTCGAEIDQARLDVVPATPFCRTCAPRR